MEEDTIMNISTDETFLCMFSDQYEQLHLTQTKFQECNDFYWK